MSTNSDRCGGRGRKTIDPLLTVGLKVASIKEREGGVEDGRVTEARSSRGYFFLSLLRVESQEEVSWALVLHASLERRYVHVRICPPSAAAIGSQFHFMFSI